MPNLETQEERARRLDAMIQEKAGSLGVANLKRIVPNLVEWTREEESNYQELEEIYGEVVGQWRRYLGHAARHVRGMHETFKTYAQDGPVYDPVPAGRQRWSLSWRTGSKRQAGSRTPTCSVGLSRPAR